ncbi:MAG: Clp protease N-terminal domain-containing protein [Nocardioidaceae bacterium]
MFERFTDGARHVVLLAQEEARRLNHNYIGTEHLLLGLIRQEEDEGVAVEALQQLNINPATIREQVEEAIGQGQHAPTPTEHVPFARGAKRSLELSLREATQLGHNYIDTEHILLGLVREAEGTAAHVLVEHGGDLNRVRAQVAELAPAGQEQAQADISSTAELAAMLVRGLQDIDERLREMTNRLDAIERRLGER